MKLRLYYIGTMSREDILYATSFPPEVQAALNQVLVLERSVLFLRARLYIIFVY